MAEQFLTLMADLDEASQHLLGGWYKKLQDANDGVASASAVILMIIGVVFIVCIRKIFEGRNEETAHKALDMIWHCFRGLTDVQVPVNSDIYGQYSELRDILGKKLRKLSAEEIPEVMRFRDFAEGLAALDGILTDRDFIRVILEINFAGLRGEKA